MNRVLSYSGLVTKIKAMQSRLLTKEQFSELADCSSVAEAVSYLKKLPGYQQDLDVLNEASMHRGAVEQYLTQSIYRDFSKIYRFSSLKQRKFMDLYVIRYEAAFLKQCLRTVYDKNTITVTETSGKWFFERYSSFDVSLLNSASTIGELIECMKGSEYYTVLSKVHDSTREGITLFDYEMTLDLFYFQNTWKTMNKLFSGEEKQILLETYGAKIDMLNIQWIYRSRKYYSMTPADIYSIIIPIHYKLKKETITAMAEAETMEAMKEIICSTYYGRQFREEDHAALEKIYRSLLDAVHKTSLRKYPYSIACVNSYLYAKEHEVNRLTTAIEGIRYGLNHDEIIQYIF